MNNQRPNIQNNKLTREDFDNFVETKNKEEIIDFFASNIMGSIYPKQPELKLQRKN